MSIRPHTKPYLKLLAIDELLENHGVESVHTMGVGRADYSNSGDCYSQTIAYCNGIFVLTTIGDLVEKYGEDESSPSNPTKRAHQMTPVIIYGPHASGKTRNAEAIKDYFGLSHIKEEWRPDQPLEADTLHLTLCAAPSLSNTLPVCTILHISEALRIIGLN